MKNIIMSHVGGAKISLLVVIIALLSGCTLKSRDTSRIQIALPPDAAMHLSNSSAASSKLSKGYLNRSFDENFLVGTADPLLPTDFTCFGLNVTGAGIPDNTIVDACKTPNMPKPGLIGGLAKVSGGTIELDVPVGTSRTIQLFAVQSAIGCPTLTDVLTGKFGSEDIGIPYEIGRTTVDIAGDSAVSIDAKWDPLNPKKLFCPKGVGVPVQLALAGQTPVITKDCSLYKVQVLDSEKTLVSLRSNLAITFSDSNSGTYFTDSNCTIPVDSTYVIKANSSSNEIYFLPGIAGEHTLSASAPGIEKASLSITANVPPPTKLLTSGQSNIAAGVCTPITVSAFDQYGVASNVVSDTTVQVSISSGSGSLYADSACTTTAASSVSLKLLVGSNVLTVYYKGNAGGSVAVATLDTATKLTTTNFSFSVAPAVPYQLAISTQPSAAATAGTVFSTQPVIAIQDMYGNTISTASNPVTLAAYIDASCTTIASGSINSSANPKTPVNGLATFTDISYNYAENIYIKATASGLTSACSSAVLVNAGAPNASNSTITINPNSVIAADGVATGTVSITLKDQFNNPISGMSTTFTASGTGNTVSQPSGPTNSAGLATGTIASSVSETKTIGIATPAGLSGVTTSVSFSATVPVVANSSIIGSGSPVADGVAQATITITLRDSSNVGVSGITPTFSASGTNNTVGSCSASDSSGISNCTLRSTRAETKTLQILTPIVKSGGSVVFGAGAAASLVFLSQPSSSGVAGVPLSVQPVVGVVDSYGNSVTSASGTVFLSASTTAACDNNFGTVVASPNPIAMAAGMASFSGTKFAHPGTVYFRAQSSGLASVCSTAVNLSPSGPYQIMIQGPESMMVGSSQQMQIKILDSEGKPANVGSATQVNLTPAYPVIYSDSAATNPISNVTVPVGSSSANFYFKDTVSRGVSIAAVDNSAVLLSDNRSVTVVNSNGEASFLEINGPIDVTQNACAGPFTVQTYNSMHSVTSVPTSKTIQLSASGAVSFYTDPGCSASTSSISIASATSSSSFYLRASDSGILKITTTDASGFLQSRSYPVSSANSGSSTQLVFLEENHISAGSCDDLAVILTGDDFKPITASSGFTMQLASTGSGQFFSDSNCTSPISSTNFPVGSSVVLIKYKNPTQQAVTLTASVSGNNPKAAMASMLIEPPHSGGGGSYPYQIALDNQTSNIPVGVCYAYRLRVKNPSWNDIPAPAAVTFNLSLVGSPAGRFYNQAGCTGSPTTTLPVAIAAGIVTSDTFWFSGPANEDINMQMSTASTDYAPSRNWYFTVGSGSGTTLAATELRVNGPNTTISGTGCETFTVNSVDHYGRPSNVVSSTPVNVTLSGGSGQFHYSPGCGDAGVTTASLSIAPSTNQTTFYFRGLSAPGLRQINVSSNGSLNGWGTGICVTDSGGNGCSMGGGTNYHLVLDGTSSNTIALGSCKLIRIKSFDQTNNPINVATAANLTINIPTGISGRLFSGGSPCTGTPQTQITTSISVGTSVAPDVWFQSSVNEDVPITVSTNHADFQPSITWYFLSGSGSGSSGSATFLAISGQSSAVFDTGCASIQVQSTDSYRRPANVTGSVSATLGFSGGSGEFHMASNCSDGALSTVNINIAPSTSSATPVYFRPLGTTGPRNISISSVSNGMPAGQFTVCGTDSGGNGCGGGGTLYGIDLDNQVNGSMPTATCRTFNLRAKNTSGWTDAIMSANVNFTVNLTQSGSGAYLYPGSSCSSGATNMLNISIPNGSAASPTFSFMGPSNSDITLAVSTSDTNFSPLRSWYFMLGAGSGSPQSASQLILNGSPSVTVNTGCLPLTVASTDFWNRNSSVGSSVSVTVSISGGMSGEFHMASDCSDAAMSTASPVINSGSSNSGTFYFRAIGATGMRQIQLMPQSGSNLYGQSAQINGI